MAKYSLSIVSENKVVNRKESFEAFSEKEVNDKIFETLTGIAEFQEATLGHTYPVELKLYKEGELILENENAGIELR